jgi:hypothetical protein
MDALATPTAAPPVLYGAPAPPGELLPWSWGRAAAGGRAHLLDRHHPPQWPPALSTRVGVWLADGFWFSTGSLARYNLATNPQITLHLERGDQVVILEGVAAAVTGAGRLQGFLAAYNPKYDWDATATDEGVTVTWSIAGPAACCVSSRL